MSCQFYVRVSDQDDSLSTLAGAFCFGYLLLYFFSLVNVISVNTVKVIIFLNSAKQ